jgi:uncharacterized protein Yka (UPF0111/DUF47 family)
MNFESEIKEIVESSHDEIVSTVKKQLQQQVIETMKYNFREDISKIVTEYTEKDLAPDIKKMLDAEKENILAELQKSCITIAAEVGKAMVETATKSLSNSYSSSEVIKKIFGGY